MRYYISSILGLLLVLQSLEAYSQSRAERLYHRAMYAFSQKKPAEAVSLLQKALDLQPDFINASSSLGEYFFKQHDFLAAKQVFAHAYQYNKSFAYPYAKTLVYCSEIATALPIIQSYQNTKRKEWKDLLTQASFIKQAMRSSHRDSVFNLQRPNPPDPEMFPWITADSSKLFFTRRINNIDDDFYTTTVDSCGGWFTGRNLGRPPNSLDNEYAQMISADGHYLFYTKCENRSKNGWAQGGCDLYISYRVHKDTAWSPPESFGATINQPGYEGMGCLSADNRTLYFISDREGGYGGKDIWCARFENGLWQAPENLGPQVNTAFDELAPYLFMDNQTLFFSSNRPQSFGGYDFFHTKKKDHKTWTEAENIGAPLNTPFDEISLCITPDGSTVYFASDRDSVAGNYDLYHSLLAEKYRPVATTLLKGYVHDSLSKQKLNYARIHIYDAQTGDEVFTVLSNKGDGSYSITLPSNKNFTTITKRFSYHTQTDTLRSFRDSSQKILYQNIALLPDDYVFPTKDSLIYTIHYIKNISHPSPEDQEALQDKLEPWLQDADKISFFINGYTDNTGTPLLNEQLSYERANIIAESIMRLGFYPSQIQATGWGEAQPLAPNDTEDNRYTNRRVEVIIRK